MTGGAPNELKTFHLFYGSQTGKAKALAEEIAEQAPDYGLKPIKFCMSLIDRRFAIDSISCAVFIVSTTGNGHPPDTAVKFFSRISRSMLESNYLEKLKYTILALGDSRHVRFCHFGKSLDRQLKGLSAESFYGTVYGDDKYGLEITVPPWIEGLWPALQKHLGVTSVTNSVQDSRSRTCRALKIIDKMRCYTLDNLALLLKGSEVERKRFPKLPLSMLEVSYGEKCKVQPFVPSSDTVYSFQDSPLTPVKLVSAKKLTSGEDVKTTLELEFRFEDVCIPYVPGDSFGFLCMNPPDEVDLLLKRLNVLDYADMPVVLQLPKRMPSCRKLPAHIPPNISLRDVFLHCVEIRTVPKKVLLRILAEFADDKNDRVALLYLSTPEGTKPYTDCVFEPSLSVLDILLHYKSCHPPVDTLIENLPCLKPRFYSVASSPLENESSFKIVFNVLEMEAVDGRMTHREGVCTGWLANLSKKLLAEPQAAPDVIEKMSELQLEPTQPSLLVYKRKNSHFELPLDMSCPVILVGPGTGIAPFVGFLQHCERLIKMKEVDASKGCVWLFYGCRYDNRDFLYKTELQRLQSSEVLNHLVVSFSRDPSPPSYVTSKYVHESIRQHAVAMVSAINSGAKIFVCGDAKHMAHDVQKAFVEVLQTSGLSEAEAKSFVEKLQDECRYINDVWA